MQVLKVRNAHAALPEGIDLLTREGYRRNSRYGEVIKIDGPVVTTYSHPWERVCFWEQRDANPFFHLLEALHMLAGKDDVYFLKQFAKRMEEFSDDRKTFHGAYGRRWRSWFKIDQIQIIIDELKKNKDNRRCVLQMWDAPKDLGKIGLDFPCNTHIYFSVNTVGSLDMTVCARSQDMIWGTYGANVVHFSVLQEYIARGISTGIGTYRQLSNDYHAYLQVFEPLQSLGDQARNPYNSSRNPYDIDGIIATEIVDINIKEWTEDLHMWFNEPFKIGLRSPFFLRVATPMYAAHLAYRRKEFDHAIEVIDSQMPPKCDWAKAAREWLVRRQQRNKL